MGHDNCRLYQETGVTVNGTGPMPCRVMVVGEAPGRNEVRLGQPFVGASGRVLDVLLTKGLQLTRDDVFITNVCKHRPTKGGKDASPSKEAIGQCLPYLLEEIQSVRPEIVIAVGAVALKVFSPTAKVSKEHGVARIVDGRVIIPWIHPAASMRPGGASLLPLMKADSERFWSEVDRIRRKNERPTSYTLIDSGVCVGVDSVVGFDTETTSPKRAGVFLTDEAKIVGYSVSLDKAQATYTPTATNLARPILDGKMAQRLLRQLVTSSTVVKVIHNAKFETKVLKNTFGLDLTNYQDTMLAAYVLGEPQVGLKTLTKQLLGIDPITFKDVTQGRDMSELAPEEVKDYACMDADHTLQLWYVLQPRLVKEGLLSVYRDIELPLVPVLARMESVGVQLDGNRASNLLSQLTTMVERADSEVVQLLDQEHPFHEGHYDFNPNSHEQLGQKLADLGLHIRKRTKVKRLLATDNDTLLSVRDQAPEVIDAIVSLRSANKLKSYLSKWIELADANGRIHTSFNQAGHYEEAGLDAKPSPQGRLSSSDPNMQNIPHHANEEWGRRIRSCIVPSPGNVLVAADVEQEEPRIIAHVAKDLALTEAFDNGRDIYRPATEAIYPETRRPELTDFDWKQRFGRERYYGKTFFLVWYYGGTEATLTAIDHRIRGGDARRGIVRLGEVHTARGQYVEAVEESLERDGYVTSLFGRKKWIPLYATGRKKDMAEAVRIGANARIQMTAADIIKIAMVKVDTVTTTNRLQSRMVLTIHDELIFDANPSEVVLLRQIVTDAFKNIVPFDLPLDIRIGQNWGEL